MKAGEWVRYAAVIGGLLLGLALARPAVITGADAAQPRLDRAADIPRGELRIEQTFVAEKNGLSAIDLLAVVFPGGEAGATLSLQLLDEAGALVAEKQVGGVAHNAPLTLSFAPQAGSRGAAFTLRLEGSAGNNTTAWAYGRDGYAGGEMLSGGRPTGGDLRFSTTYRYQWNDMLADSLAEAGRLARRAAPLWLVLFAPGLLALEFLGGWQARWARWGVALGLSIALAGLAWLWVGVAGRAWSPMSLGAAYAVVGGLWLIRRIYKEWATASRGGYSAARPGRAALTMRGQAALARPGPHDAAMACILLVSIAVRLLAVRDLALPTWVDSPHHVVIAQLLAAAGAAPTSYLPLLPIDTFAYHFGAHAPTVALHWLTGDSLPDTLLLLGQLLNGLMPLAIYALAASLVGRRAALAAAAWVGLVSLFPGYYATWGRYSQLAGLLVMAPAMAAVWRIFGPRARPALVVLLALLAAGVLLTHYRVLIFFVVFVLAAAAVHWRACGRLPRLAAATGLGALLVLPWLIRLLELAVLPVLETPARLAIQSSYNAFPAAYFQSGLERASIGLALLALAVGLVRRNRALWAIGLWVGAIFAALNLAGPNWLVNQNAWAISLFVPASLLLGWGADGWRRAALRLTAPGARRLAVAAGAAMLFAACCAGVWGVRRGLETQVAIINPATVLATRDDLQALAWVAGNTPHDAVFLVNGWEWLNGTWAGSDGGGWLIPLTGRQSTLPTVDYAFGPRDWQARISNYSARAAALRDAGAPESLALLSEASVTHIYIGARGGHLTPEMFVGQASYRLMFTNGAAWVFEVVE